MCSLTPGLTLQSCGFMRRHDTATIADSFSTRDSIYAVYARVHKGMPPNDITQWLSGVLMAERVATAAACFVFVAPCQSPCHKAPDTQTQRRRWQRLRRLRRRRRLSSAPFPLDRGAPAQWMYITVIIRACSCGLPRVHRKLTRMRRVYNTCTIHALKARHCQSSRRCLKRCTVANGNENYTVYPAVYVIYM